jgi:hypothetical protein
LGVKNLSVSKQAEWFLLSLIKRIRIDVPVYFTNQERQYIVIKDRVFNVHWYEKESYPSRHALAFIAAHRPGPGHAAR